MHERARFERTGLMVSRLAFGGIPIQKLSPQEGVRLVANALDLGINFIDTAHGYGHSEEVIGEAMALLFRAFCVELRIEYFCFRGDQLPRAARWMRTASCGMNGEGGIR